MLEIKILGTGCAGCLTLEQRVVEVLQELRIRNVNVERVTEQRMIEYGLIADRAPGLLVNGRLAWAGSVPTKEQLKDWIKQAEILSAS